MIEHQSPVSYAKHLATYLKDPSTIRAHVKTKYGRAPSVDVIRKIQREIRKTERVDGYQLCESRYRPHFKCGHPETEDNIVIGLNGIDKCKACEDAKVRRAEEKEAARQARMRAQLARERAEREAKRASIENLLERLIRKPAPNRPRVGTALIQEAAAFFKITYDDIVGPDRARIFIDARCVVAIIMRERGLSYPQIGRFLKRDHSTVINWIDKAAERMARNPSMLKALEALR